MNPDPVKTSKRQMFMMIVSGLCGLGAIMGTLPVDSKDIPLPPEWRPYIISIGFFGLTMERWGKFVIAYFNNIKFDNLNLPLLAFLCICLSSCGVTFTEDGCILGNYTKGGSSYAAGPCVGADSQIDRFRVQWSNDQKQKLRATYWTKAKKPVLIEYFTGELWLKWSSKSGVLIGPVPPEVEDALKGKPEPIPAPTPNIPIPVLP